MSLPVGATATVVDALRDKIRALLPVLTATAGAQVYDGPAPEKAYAARWVSVASAFETNEGGVQDAVSVERSESGARPTVTETFTVACSAYSGGGGLVFEAHRETVGQLLTAIDNGLRADRSLSGAVSLARIGSASWGQLRDTAGSAAIANFTVNLTVLS